MKQRKRSSILIILVAILITALATPVVANAATNWTTKRQEQVNTIISTLRDMGYGENSAAVRAMQDVLALEGGDTSAINSYYYSGVNKDYYFLNVADKTVVNPDGSYFDGTYFWYLDNSTGYYYRYDKWGNRITGAKSNYNVWGGRNLWNGIITGTEYCYTTQEAETVAKFILSYADLTDGSVRERAELAWCLLNCKGDGDMAKTIKKFEDYNKYASLTTEKGKEALSIAKDVLYRHYIEKYADIVSVGRVLPKKYSWMWIQDGKVYLRKSKDGANWDHSSASPY